MPNDPHDRRPGSHAPSPVENAALENPCEVIADVLGDIAGILNSAGKSDLSVRVSNVSNAMRRAPQVAAASQAAYERSSIPRLQKMLRERGLVSHRTPPAYVTDRKKESS